MLIYAKEEVSAQSDIELSDCNEEILWSRLAGGNILSTSNMQEEEAKINSNIIKECSRMSNKEVMLCEDFNHNTINWNELEATVIFRFDTGPWLNSTCRNSYKTWECARFCSNNNSKLSEKCACNRTIWLKRSQHSRVHDGV